MFHPSPCLRLAYYRINITGMKITKKVFNFENKSDIIRFGSTANISSLANSSDESDLKGASVENTVSLPPISGYLLEL